MISKTILILVVILLSSTSVSALQRNVAGQSISGQLTSKTDGGPVTGGTTTVSVVCDGSFAAGGGSVAHKGNGSWLYTPTQAETNCAHATFIFSNTDAVTMSVQTYPGEIPAVLSEEHGAGPWVK